MLEMTECQQNTVRKVRSKYLNFDSIINKRKHNKINDHSFLVPSVCRSLCCCVFDAMERKNPVSSSEIFLIHFSQSNSTDDQSVI